MGGHISDYARFLDGAVKRHDSALLATRLENDEVKELVSALWDIVDEYGEHRGDGELSEGMGGDEE